MKYFKKNFEESVKRYKAFLKLPSIEKDLYPENYKGGNPEYLGVPLSMSLEDVTHLEYRMPVSFINTSTVDEFLDWIQEVTAALPQWFKDFSFKREDGFAIASVDCSGSFLRNYNALRFLRSIVYRYNENPTTVKTIPVDALLVFAEAYHLDKGEFFSRNYMGDDACIPFRLFHSLKGVLERVHSGPMECDFDTPLLMQDTKSIEALRDCYGTTSYPLSNAFLTPSERLKGEYIGNNSHLPTYIPRLGADYIEQVKGIQL